MFGCSKVMHIAAASDADVEAFEAHEINELVAFCGQRIARNWLFGIGGARNNAPTCPTCAELAGWIWDPETSEWTSPYIEVEEVAW